MRGYNQSALLAEGIASVIQKPVADQLSIRNRNTQTQTHQSRTGRWQSVMHAFVVQNDSSLRGKHVLLVDDIVTTGATLEACGEVILSIPGTTLSIATAAYTI